MSAALDGNSMELLEPFKSCNESDPCIINSRPVQNKAFYAHSASIEIVNKTMSIAQ